MDVQKTIGGSLQISTEVLAKIARLAALEIDGVAEVTTGGSQNVRGLLGPYRLRSRSTWCWRMALPPLPYTWPLYTAARSCPFARKCRKMSSRPSRT